MEMDPRVQRVCESYRYICFYFFIFPDLMHLFFGFDETFPRGICGSLSRPLEMH